MTNFFGIRSDQAEKAVSGFNEAFIEATVSPMLAQDMEQFAEQAERLKKDASLPAPLRILKGIVMLFSVILISALLRGSLKVGLARAYANAPYFFWALAVLIPLWLILFLYEKSRKREAEDTGEPARMEESADRLEERAREELGIPRDAPGIDVLAQRYALKKGEYVSKETSLHVNLDLLLFLRDGNLCLSDERSVWAIPLSALGSAALTRKYIPMNRWNKQESPSSDAYKPYKVRENQYGWFFARCWRVEIRDPRGDFYLLIPNYDGEAFARLTGLRPESEN